MRARKIGLILSCVALALAVLALAAFGWLYFNLTAQTAPVFAQESLDGLAQQAAQAAFKGDDLQLTPGQLNRLLALLPAEQQGVLQGVELTGENTVAVWCRHRLFGRNCDVRLEATLTYDPQTGVLTFLPGNATVGNLALPPSLTEKLLAEKEEELGLQPEDLALPVNRWACEWLHLGDDVLLVRDLRCDADGLYLTPGNVGDLLGGWLGGLF